VGGSFEGGQCLVAARVGSVPSSGVERWEAWVLRECRRGPEGWCVHICMFEFRTIAQV
jgi:hypothetical protein